MKYSVFALSALVAAVAAKPAFLNSGFELQEGQPFEIKYSGCEDGCTIVLQTGDPDALKDVTTLTATAEGSSFTWTPSDLPSGTYSFKITSNGDQSVNYSVRFEYSGTGTLTSSVSTASATSSATGSSSASKSASGTTGSTSASSASSVSSAPATSSSSSAILSRNATITTTLSTASSKPVEVTTTKKSEEPAKTTAAATTAATTVPNSGATRLGSSLALVAGAIMAMVYLN